MSDGSRATFTQPRSLLTVEIYEIVDHFRRAVRNAMLEGFHGIEIHKTHGYLIDQIINDDINNIVDEYSGSIENHCHFAHEIV